MGDVIDATGLFNVARRKAELARMGHFTCRVCRERLPEAFESALVGYHEICDDCVQAALGEDEYKRRCDNEL